MAALTYLQKFIKFLRMLSQNSYMIRSMVNRNMRARYVGSYMGLFWSVIHPISQLLIYYFVFSVVLKMRLGEEYGSTSYAIWLVAGLLPWMFFSEVVNQSPRAILEQSTVIKKVVFPSELLPVIFLTTTLVNHLIRLTILFSFILILGYGVSFKILFLLLYLFTIGIFALGISWLLSSLNVFLRDIGHVLPVVIQIWLYLTPIFYPSHMIPPSVRWIYELNPMFHAVNGYRMALLGKADMDFRGLAILMIVAITTFVVGGLTFQKLKPAFADVL